VKLPEYSLKQSIRFFPPSGGPDDMVEFHPGTLLFVFWNETLLPDHIRKRLDENKKSIQHTNGTNKFTGKAEGKLIMCIIGKHWVPVPSTYIRSNG
jgi:hypothetical protein